MDLSVGLDLSCALPCEVNSNQSKTLHTVYLASVWARLIAACLQSDADRNRTSTLIQTLATQLQPDIRHCKHLIAFLESPRWGNETPSEALSTETLIEQ